MSEHFELPTLSRDEFEVAITQPGALIVDLWAPWCPPCRMMSPALHKLAAEHASNVRVVKVVLDGNRDLKERYDVPGIPTLLYFLNGELVNKTVGYGGYEYIRAPFAAFIEKVTGAPKPSPAESEALFVANEKLAEKAYELVSEPTSRAYIAVMTRADKNKKRTIKRAENALKAATISEAEKDRRIARANAKFKSADEAATKVYEDTIGPVERAYLDTVAAAAGIFAESLNTTGDHSHGVCAIGDKTCSA